MLVTRCKRPPQPKSHPPVGKSIATKNILEHIPLDQEDNPLPKEKYAFISIENPQKDVEIEANNDIVEDMAAFET